LCLSSHCEIAVTGLQDKVRRSARLGLVLLLLSAAGAGAAAKAPRPDLVEATLSNPPATVPAGTRFQVTDVTRNRGRAKARASATAFYLQKDGRRTAIGFSNVSALKAGKADSRTVALLVPLEADPGIYRLAACADSRHVVRESREANNCRFAARPVQVSKPLPPPA
jgi:hypothetical protein